jgi:hypothetical protein
VVKKTRSRRLKAGIPQKATQRALFEWRRSVWSRDYSHQTWAPPSLLSNEIVKLVSSLGPIDSIADLATILSSSWGHWQTLGEELFRFLSTLDLPFEPLPPKDSKRTQRAAAKRLEQATSNLAPGESFWKLEHPPPSPREAPATFTSSFDVSAPAPSQHDQISLGHETTSTLSTRTRTRASDSRPRSDLPPLATALSNERPLSSRLSCIDVNTSTRNSTPSSYNRPTYNQIIRCVVLFVFILVAGEELR